MLKSCTHRTIVAVSLVLTTFGTAVLAQETGAESTSVVQLGPKLVTDHKAKSMTGPSLHIDDAGSVSMAWMEENREVRSVLYARSLKPGSPWETAVRVNRPEESPYWRQESPALVLNGEEVYIAWARTHAQAGPDKPFASELRLSRSMDAGRTFLPSILINDDDQAINHSFDALHVDSDGNVHVAWIDGRDGKKDPGTFVAHSADHGVTMTKNLKVDENTCVCCRTAVAEGPDGALYVAWRKIFEGNIRETVVARSTDGGRTFSPPVIVGHDNWDYPGCPHRPASIAVDNRGRLYVVWYTEGADESPAVYLAYSDDKGTTFSQKRQLNHSKGTFPDHPQMAVDPSGHVVVVWEEQSPVRREIVMSYSLDQGQSFSAAQKVNEKKGQSPAVSVNRHGLVALGWMEHAMPGHKMIVQTMQLPTTHKATLNASYEGR